MCRWRPQSTHRAAERLAAATDLFLVDFERVSVLHVQLHHISLKPKRRGRGGDCNGKRTVSGLSVGCTRWPSNRNRTLEMFLPWRSQKASMSFFSCVVRLILKKTSLLLSVTLMLRCSDWPPSSGFCCMLFGEPLSDIVMVARSGSCCRSGVVGTRSAGAAVRR